MTTPETQAGLWRLIRAWVGAGPSEAGLAARDAINAILDRLHEREETEEQRARRELGAWLTEYSCRRWRTCAPDVYDTRWTAILTDRGDVEIRGYGAMDDDAVLNALSKAKEASGG